MRKNAPQYQDYQKMIQKMSWKYARKSYVEREEIEAQGNLIFCEAAATWEPKRGAFSTHLYTCLKNGLLSFIMREQQIEGDERLAIDTVLIEDEDGEVEPLHVAITPAPDRALEFRQVLCGMTALSTAVVTAALLDYSKLGLTGFEYPREARGVIARTLNEQGIEWGVVWDTMREIKTTLQKA